MIEKPDYLNEIEEAEVQKFLENKTMSGAVKKVILANILFEGTLEKGKPVNTSRNILMQTMMDPLTEKAPDEIYAGQVRGMVAGIRLLETGYSKLEALKKEEVVEEKKVNKGR